MCVLMAQSFAQIKRAGTGNVGIPQAVAFADSMYRTAPYVFDATVGKEESFYGAEGKIYTSRILKIEKVRRGNLKLGTIEVINRYGCIGKRPDEMLSHEQWGICEGFSIFERLDRVYFRTNGVGKYTIFAKPTSLLSHYGEPLDNPVLETFHELSTSIKHQGERLGGFLFGGITCFDTEEDFTEAMTYYKLNGNSQTTLPKKQRGNGEADQRTQTNDANIKFDKKTVIAGNDEVLTINYTGTTGGFGSTIGQVRFRDANNWNNTLGNEHYFFPAGVDDKDLISWTNTQIKVKVPSFVEKGYANDPDYNVLHGCAGSGEVKIVRSNGVELISVDKINIKYGFNNPMISYYPDGTTIHKKSKLLLANYKCGVPPIKVVAHNSLTAGQRKVVWAACRNWNNTLGTPIFKFSETAAPVSYTSSAVESVIRGDNTDATQRNNFDSLTVVGRAYQHTK